MQEVFQVQKQPARHLVREKTIEPVASQEPQPQEELTREQYLELLKTAQRMRKELAYLAIRMVVGTGIQLQEFLALTVENVQPGEITTSERTIHLADSLREELLDYARRSGSDSGLIFLGKTGVPLHITTVRNQIRSVSRAAGLDDSAATVKALQNLFETTRAELMAKTTERLMMEQLDREQAEHGWES